MLLAANLQEDLLKSFRDLTPIGQARRLRPLAAHVLDAFDIRPIRLRQLTAAANVASALQDAEERAIALDYLVRMEKGLRDCLTELV